MKFIRPPLIAAIALLGALPAGLQAAASGEHTAAHVKAYADEYEGEKVTLDVVFIRFHRQPPEDVPYTFFWAMTVDEDARSGGGAILVVADADERNSLIRRYGTNLDRDRGDGPEIESMRGVVRIAEGPRGKHGVYIDLTDEGVDLSNAPNHLFDGGDDEGGEFYGPPPGRGPGGGRPR